MLTRAPNVASVINNCSLQFNMRAGGSRVDCRRAYDECQYYWHGVEDMANSYTIHQIDLCCECLENSSATFKEHFKNNKLSI